MVKSVGLLTRKDGMSHEQFMKHWVEVHAPLAHAVPGLVRYVQSHIVEERRRPDIPATDVEIDGIAELWYEDAAAMARAMAAGSLRETVPTRGRVRRDRGRGRTAAREVPVRAPTRSLEPAGPPPPANCEAPRACRRPRGRPC
jgi:uncharacterized protein (TIGR02118 family)